MEEELFGLDRRITHAEAATPPSHGHQQQLNGPLVFRIPTLADDALDGGATDHSSCGSGSDCGGSSKRRRANAKYPQSSNDESLASGQETTTKTTNAPGTTTPTRTKKRWYAVQKDEMNALEKEIERLQAQKALLEESPPDRMAALLAQQKENERLRQGLLHQQLLLARSQSALTGRSLAQGPPFERCIHLSSDWNDRKAMFTTLKHATLRDAELYINERLQFLDPSVKYSQAEKFELPSGDICFSGFDVIPVPGFTSVRQVFDVMRNFFFNMEIRYTEESGELMVREGDFDESGDADVATQRFVRSTTSGAQIESNSVLFTGFREGQGGGEGDSAILAVDFVNQDELHPYNPSTRLRQDTTAAIYLRACPPNTNGAGSTSEPSAATPPVLLVRSHFAKLHKSEGMAIPQDAVEGMNYAASFCFKSMLQAVREV